MRPPLGPGPSGRRGRVASILGFVLIGGVVIDVALSQSFSPRQPVLLLLGTVLVAVSNRLRLGPRSKGLLSISTGAVVVAVGVGLAPHLVKSGLTAYSALSAAAVVAGVALVVIGARSLLRDVAWPGKVGGTVGVVIAAVLAVWVIAPPVAATNVPATHIDATPEDLGRDFEAVRLTTSDGVDLAAWYLPGTNGAGVVVLHGAGSTRSDVLEQSSVLVDHGYAALLIDARGHGDSGGTAMDFGWHGDLDVAAGTDFLASRDEIDPGRIGVVGFSMGGEEAIGAAGADRRLRAVVAEGATGRRGADKAWLSEVYGWRGWVQERLESLQDAVTDYLTDASPPTVLRSAVSQASGTRFLLITAGNVADEAHAARYIRSGAAQRTTVWNVEGADHVGGYDADPAGWEDNVVGFLDAALR